MTTRDETHTIRFGAAFAVLFLVVLSLNVYAFH